MFEETEESDKGEELDELKKSSYDMTRSSSPQKSITDDNQDAQGRHSLDSTCLLFVSLAGNDLTFSV